jgi:C-terminal processing protease CtpA/Prc
MIFLKRTLLLSVAGLLLAGVPQGIRAQGLNSIDRESRLDALRTLRDLLKKRYYDPKFHGVDLDAQYAAAVAKMRQATTLGRANAYVAAFLGSLHDSHTYYVPGGQSIQVDYGYQAEIIGDDCYITQVEPGSGAVEKLQPGDAVAGIDGFRVDRANYFQLSYFLRELSLQSQTTFVVKDPDGKIRSNVVVQTKMVPRRITDDQGGVAYEAETQDQLRRIEGLEQSLAIQYHDFADVFVAKMPSFLIDTGTVDDLMAKARKKSAVIIDLRGNGGGSLDALKRLVSYFFNHDVTIDNPISRDNKVKPLVAKTRGKETFAGKVVVLVDSQSASASELFARVMQLEHRGVVVGDRSSGYVMEAQFFPLPTEMNFQYGALITQADLIMKDGKSLEGVGVTPDYLVLPTGEDLAKQRDPAMSKALALVGINMDAAAAKLFTFNWEKPKDAAPQIRAVP